jgi:hypothetical protein
MRAGHIAAAVAAGILAWLPAGEARAANGAYAVDAADIGEAGSCKIESWLSAASNTDFSAVANPSCVVNPFKPVELSMLTNRARSEGEWSVTLQPKAKMNIAPTGVGRLGYSIYAGGSFDALTGDNLTAFAVVPATFRLSENARLNFNGGWLWDRSVRTPCNGPSKRSGRRAVRIRLVSCSPASRPAYATGPTRFSRWI